MDGSPDSGPVVDTNAFFAASLLLLASVAEAQSLRSANPALFGSPMVRGRRHQPTQREIELRAGAIG